MEIKPEKSSLLFLIFLVLGSFSTFSYAEEEKSPKSCSRALLSSEKDAWKTCVNQLDQSAASFETSLLGGVQSAVAIEVADKLLSDGFKGTILGQTIFGAQNNATPLQQAVKLIISEIRKSEQNIIDALDELVESRDYANFNALSQQVEIYNNYSNAIKLLNSSQVKVEILTQKLSTIAQLFLTHQDFDLKTYKEIKFLEISLSAEKHAVFGLTTGTPEEISDNLKRELRIIGNNMFEDLKSKFVNININNIKAAMITRTSRYWGGDGALSCMSSGYNSMDYYIGTQPEFASITMDCAPDYKSILDGYGSCLTSLHVSDYASDRFKKTMQSVMPTGRKTVITNEYYQKYRYTFFKGIYGIPDHYNSDYSSLMVTPKEMRCSADYDWSFNSLDNLFTPVRGFRITAEAMAAILLIENRSFPYFNTLKFFEDITGAPFTSTFQSEGYATYWRDQDNDGLKFYEEVELGSSDYRSDTDHDGIPDYIESHCRQDPTVKSPTSNEITLQNCGFNVTNIGTRKGLFNWKGTLQPGEKKAYLSSHTCTGHKKYNDDDIRGSFDSSKTNLFIGAFRRTSSPIRLYEISSVIMINNSGEAANYDFDVRLACSD